MYILPSLLLEKLFKEKQIEEESSRIDLFRKGIEKSFDGLIAEFGVHTGSTIKEIKQYTNKKVYGFDVFTEPMKEDFTPSISAGIFKYTEEQIPKFNNSDITIIKGYYEDTLIPFLQSHFDLFSFIHLDSDVYSATKYVLTTLAKNKRLTKGTIIQFDELFYIEGEYWYCGEYLALMELCRDYGLKYNYLGKHKHHVSIQIEEIK